MARRKPEDAERSPESPDSARETTRTDRTAQARAAANRVRARISQLVWVLCALAALVLAVGALCIALKANPTNGLVKFSIDTADKLDFGVFSRKSGVAHWQGHTHAALTKNALVNWGMAAIVWLIIGKVVERVIAPSAGPVSSARGRRA